MAGRDNKIAVLLIHGIGDQRPMATLRSFVEALLQPLPGAGDDGGQPGANAAATPAAAAGRSPADGPAGALAADPEPAAADGRPLYWSKPDELSQSFELRRYHAPGGRDRAPIDFYEYYWAHKMEGNALGHSIQWINNLLLRRPGSVPEKLRKLWWLCWAMLAVGLALSIYFWGKTPAGLIGAVAAITLGLAKLIADFALRDWIGDAARYFDDRPQNIGVRETIRRGGVELLKKLHDSGEYHRIIVVGHSLGSAIALDILYHYWTGAREMHGKVDRPVEDARSSLEKLLKANGPIGPEDIRVHQKAIWTELQANGVPWRVTDLVTLGSPLTHLPFLTRLTSDAFRARLKQRELPTCPPILDGKGIAYWSRYETAAGESRSIGTLHHAACFAATRWTNIYFEHDGWFGGDPVGGPLASLFGTGVADVAVTTAHWKGRLNHVDYWRDDPRDALQPGTPLRTLRSILDFKEAFRLKPPAARARPPAPSAPKVAIPPAA